MIMMFPLVGPGGGGVRLIKEFEVLCECCAIKFMCCLSSRRDSNTVSGN